MNITNIEKHVVTALQGATVSDEPFPFFFAQNVFPTETYEEIQNYLNEDHSYHSLKFANRTFADKVDIPGLEFMNERPFFIEMMSLFDAELKAKFGGRKMQFMKELRLVRDAKDYKIGPHTDAPWKVLSLLFYLPPNEALREYGTAIFVPKDHEFRCEGGPHYPFDPFVEVWRAPFIPNSCLGFWKTNQSFHGVWPIPTPVRRDVLLYNVYQKVDQPEGEPP